MRVGLPASAILHGSILVALLVSFSIPRTFDVPPESISVDVVSASELSKITKGSEKGKKTEPPKLVAEKVDVEKPAPDPSLKVTDKQEIAPTQASAPPPPVPKPEPKPEPEPPKPEPPKAEAPKPEAPKPAKAEPPPPKADEALKADPKKDPPKEPPKPQQAQPTPVPPKRPDPPKEPPKQVADAKVQNNQPFNADQISALLDKRAPQRQAATAAVQSQISSLGASKGEAATLSVSELDAFREKVKQCWKMPHISDDKIYAYVLLRLNRDGTLAQPPVITDGLMNPEQKSVFDAFASSAMRALIQCQPYTMFKPEKYDAWKELEPRFYPNMFGG